MQWWKNRQINPSLWAHHSCHRAPSHKALDRTVKTNQCYKTRKAILPSECSFCHGIKQEVRDFSLSHRRSRVTVHLRFNLIALISSNLTCTLAAEKFVFYGVALQKGDCKHPGRTWDYFRVLHVVKHRNALAFYFCWAWMFNAHPLTSIDPRWFPQVKPYVSPVSSFLFIYWLIWGFILAGLIVNGINLISLIRWHQHDSLHLLCYFEMCNQLLFASARQLLAIKISSNQSRLLQRLLPWRHISLACFSFSFVRLIWLSTFILPLYSLWSFLRWIWDVSLFHSHALFQQIKRP